MVPNHLPFAFFVSGCRCCMGRILRVSATRWCFSLVRLFPLLVIQKDFSTIQPAF
jgi:hypothetical protein